MNVKNSDEDDDGIEDIDVDQTTDVLPSQTPPQNFDVAMAEVHQGGSSQENLLQIQLQMREQQQREQLVLVNAGDQATAAAAEESSPQTSEKSEPEAADALAPSIDDSCSNDTTSDLERGDTREGQLETELEQQVNFIS